MTSLLLTRFAVRYGRTGVRPEPLSQAWFDGRFDLFERYCLPSVQRQTWADFRWYIYVDAAVETWVSDRLRAYDPRIEIRTEDYHCPPADLTGRVVSTRLDSDDAIAPHVMARIHAEAEAASSTPLLVDFATGYHWHHQRRIGYVGRGRAFKALIEDGPRYHGVYVHKCEDMPSHFRTVRVDAPAWLRVVHGGNLTNRFTFGRPLATAEVLQVFPWIG